MNYYIIPKYILEDLTITENNKLFKIKHSYKDLKFIITFGIFIKLDIKEIIKKMNNYLVYLNNIDELINYDNYLDSNIRDYKKIVKDKQYFIISDNSKIEENILTNNRDNVYLNIKYVKKTGFLNIPIIELYNG